MGFFADDLYGGGPSPQPTGTPVADHPAGTPEPKVRTVARPSAKGLLGDPVFILVAVLGLAFAILHVSVRGSVSLGVGG